MAMLLWKVLLFGVLLPVLASAKIFSEDEGFPLQGARPAAGSPWPLPRVWRREYATLTFVPGNLTLASDLVNCDLVTAAFDRLVAKLHRVDVLEGRGDVDVDYSDDDYSDNSPDVPVSGEIPAHVLTSIHVHVGDEHCPWYPGLGMKEDYNLTIGQTGVVLSASSGWGVIWGMETLSQLAYKLHGQWLLNEGEIEDDATFSHRGVMLDTARHFYDVHTIKHTLDAMSMNKLNVLHWHIVGSHSFPYMTWWFPELAVQGAFSPRSTYTIADVHDIIDYARLRGIRVVPEFNTPGQIDAWTKALPELAATPCLEDDHAHAPRSTMDPSKSATYDFLAEFFWEATIHFQDDLLHTGMRGVTHCCWRSNPDIAAFMVSIGLNATDFTGLEEYHGRQVQDIVEAEDRRAIVWEDALKNGAKVSNRTVIQMWKDNPTAGSDVMLQTTLLAGYDVISSSCWDLSASNHGDDWQAFYTCDPFDGVQDAHMSQVLGGEATLWTNFVDETNLMQTVWPRAAAMAERLWSSGPRQDTDEVAYRLDQHRCRMLKQGFQVPPIIPGFCSDNYNTDNSDAHQQLHDRQREEEEQQQQLQQQQDTLTTAHDEAVATSPVQGGHFETSTHSSHHTGNETYTLRDTDATSISNGNVSNNFSSGSSSNSSNHDNSGSDENDGNGSSNGNNDSSDNSGSNDSNDSGSSSNINNNNNNNSNDNNNKADSSKNAASSDIGRRLIYLMIVCVVSVIQINKMH